MLPGNPLRSLNAPGSMSNIDDELCGINNDIRDRVQSFPEGSVKAASRQRSSTHNQERHTTRPQPHEQLLVGWIVGGRMARTTSSSIRNRNEERWGGSRTTPSDGPAPSPITASNCSQGGQVRGRRRGGSETMTRGNDDANGTTTT